MLFSASKKENEHIILLFSSFFQNSGFCRMFATHSFKFFHFFPTSFIFSLSGFNDSLLVDVAFGWVHFNRQKKERKRKSRDSYFRQNVFDKTLSVPDIFFTQTSEKKKQIDSRLVNCYSEKALIQRKCRIFAFSGWFYWFSLRFSCKSDARRAMAAMIVEVETKSRAKMKSN